MVGIQKLLRDETDGVEVLVEPERHALSQPWASGAGSRGGAMPVPGGAQRRFLGAHGAGSRGCSALIPGKRAAPVPGGRAAPVPGGARRWFPGGARRRFPGRTSPVPLNKPDLQERSGAFLRCKRVQQRAAVRCAHHSDKPVNCDLVRALPLRTSSKWNPAKRCRRQTTASASTSKRTRLCSPSMALPKSRQAYGHRHPECPPLCRSSPRSIFQTATMVQADRPKGVRFALGDEQEDRGHRP